MKNNQITSLRGILIFLIMIYHYTYKFEELFEISTISFWGQQYLGIIGSASFFIISGYFIFPNKLDNFSVNGYLKKKIFRLWPTYAIGITITFLSISIFGLPGRECNFIDYILNMFMINGFIGTRYVDGAHWYITYLLLFIFITTIIVILQKKYEVNRMTLVNSWSVIDLVFTILSKYFEMNSRIYMLIGEKYVAFFILGIVIKEMQHNKDFKRYVFSILCAMCVILLKEHWITIIGVLIFLFSFVLAINYKLKFLNAKTLVYIGGISYPLYIIHQNLGYQLMLCMTKMLNKFSNIYILVTIIMAILIATLLQYMSEKFANLLKNKSIGKQNF